MDEVTRISDIRDQAPVLRVKIASDDIAIKVFFNMNCCITFLESHKQGDSYRSAFAKSVYIMHTGKDEEDAKGFEESGFENISDEDFSCIINSILESDISLKAEYEKALGNSQYERFYRANEEVIKSATKGISTSLKRVSCTFDNMNKPLLASLQGAANIWRMSPGFDTPHLQSAFTSACKIPHIEMSHLGLDLQGSSITGVQSLVSAASKIYNPELFSALERIRQPIFNVMEILKPINDMVQDLHYISDNLAQMLQVPYLVIAESTKSFLSSIDFSLLAYRKDWSEQRETFLAYGWFYIEQLPENFIADVHERKDELDSADVDTMITSYFRQNNCAPLKQMVKSWKQLPYFECRKSVFHEALVNYSRRYFNSSAMMITLQTEGIITDFVRLQLRQPRYKAKVALADIKAKLEDSDSVSIYEFEVFTDIIERIDNALQEAFDCSNPDITSNQSRDKIAHGHAYTPETEVDSLKQFLYLNEMYHLLQLLSSEK